MKNLFLVLAMACMLVVSCGKKQKEEVVTVPEPPKPEVYQPVHKSQIVDFKTAKTYAYNFAPSNVAAKAVEVNYDVREYYTKPIEVVFIYPNGDTFTYVLNNFGIWDNENGKPRVIADDNCTVWIQGQTKYGKFHEFVFYGDPKYNGSKIKPNSYRNLPAGEIKYRK